MNLLCANPEELGGYSNEVELNSDNFHIEDLQPETNYKARIISRCAFENSSEEWDSITFETNIDNSDYKCGDPAPQLALEFTDPLAQLFVGDMVYIDASTKDKTLLIPLKVTDAGIHNNDGSFTGVKANLSIGFDVLEAANMPPIKLKSDKIWLDKNYTLVGGSFYSFNENMWSQIANADAIDFGGSIRGQYMSGATNPDSVLVGKIDTMSLTGTTLYVTVTENGQQQTKTVNVSDKEAFVVADSQNNIWAVNTETSEVAYLGKKSEYSNALDNIDLSIIADADMQVKFSNADGAKYALDPLSDDYISSMFFSSTDKYEYLPINGNTGNKYKVPWKFMASDNTDKVKVDIPQNIVRDSLHFITSTKLEVELDADILNLSSGDDGSFYEVYALYNDTDGQQKLCGKLKVFTKTEKPMTVHLVPFYEEPNINAGTIQAELNAIYNRYGIDWEVEIIEGFEGENIWDLDGNEQMTLGDDFLSNYSGEQKMVNGLIMGLEGIYNQTDCYVALFDTTATYGSDDDDDKYTDYLKGEMPIGKQFAYLYDVNGDIDARLLAHELGHGRFKLRHTFGSEPSLSITQGETTNLMDYPSAGSGTTGNDSLVYAQWEAIHNPALIGKVFQDDGDGAGYDVCTLAKVLEYFDATQSESKAKLEARKDIYQNVYDNFETLYADLEANAEKTIPDDEIGNIEGWSVRGSSLSSNSKGFLYERILKKIEEAENATDISFSLNEKGIYLGKAKINDLDYNLAIYSDKESTAIQKLLAKDYCEIINDEEINKVVKVAEIDDYLLFAFFKDGEIEMAIQMMGDDDEKMKELLIAFKVLKGETDINDIVKYPCSVCGRDLTVSYERLQKIFPGSKFVNQTNADHFNEALKDCGFTTCKQHAHFFSQIYEESSHFTDFEEDYFYRFYGIVTWTDDKGVEHTTEVGIYQTFGGQTGNSTKDTIYAQSFWDKNRHLYYTGTSKCGYLYEKKDKSSDIPDENNRYIGVGGVTKERDGLKITFPKTFEKNETGTYVKYDNLDARKSGENLFNLVYAKKGGNGDVSSGDGWRYRGRGAIQLTLRNNYKNISKKCNDVFEGKNFDWENNPDDVGDVSKPDAIIFSAVGWFLNNFSPITSLDTKTSEQVTKVVNARSLKEAERKNKFNDLMNNEELYKCDPK